MDTPRLLVMSPLGFNVLGGGIHVTCYLRFTSGATPADLLAASMAVKPFSSTYLQACIGGT